MEITEERKQFGDFIRMNFLTKLLNLLMFAVHHFPGPIPDYR